MKDIRSTVIIPAAGKGKRMNHHQSKQYIELKGKPILAHTIEAFASCDDITHIIIVVGKGEIDYCQREVVDRFGLEKVYAIIEGGKERQDSVYEGIKSVPKESDIVLIHDAARPFIEESLIRGTIEEAVKSGACVLGVPVKDTIKIADQKNNVLKTPSRKTLWAIQTPQTFQLEVIKEAYHKAMEAGFIATDDAMMVEEFSDREVKILEGSYVNIKITTQEDLKIANSFQ